MEQCAVAVVPATAGPEEHLCCSRSAEIERPEITNPVCTGKKRGGAAHRGVSGFLKLDNAARRLLFYQKVCVCGGGGNCPPTPVILVDVPTNFKLLDFLNENQFA